MAWVGRDLQAYPVSTPLLYFQVRLPKAQSNLALNISSDGASSAFLGRLLQCLSTP